MEKLIVKITFILILCITISCNPFCSDKDISKGDKIKIESLNKHYVDYKIEIDKCLPSGYVNVYNLNSSLDSLKIKEIFYEVQKTKILANRLKIFNNEKKFVYELYGVYDSISNRIEVFKLRPEDL